MTEAQFRQQVVRVAYRAAPVPASVLMGKGWIRRSSKYEVYVKGLRLLIREQLLGGPDDLLGDFLLRVQFTCPRGDIDNLCKGVLDAGTGLLWVDDRQVIKVEALIVRKGKPEVLFEVRRRVGETESSFPMFERVLDR